MKRKKISKIFSFFRYVVSEKRVLLSITSSILLIVAPFLNWISWSLDYEGVSEKETYNMFQLAKGDFDLNICIFFGICFVIISIGFIVLEIFDFIKNLRDKKRWIQLVEYVFLVLLIVMVVTIINNDQIVQYISYKDGEIAALEYWIEGAKGYCNRGLGPVVAILGLVMAIISRIGVVVYMLFSSIGSRVRRK